MPPHRGDLLLGGRGFVGALVELDVRPAALHRPPPPSTFQGKSGDFASAVSRGNRWKPASAVFWLHSWLHLPTCPAPIPPILLGIGSLTPYLRSQQDADSDAALLHSKATSPAVIIRIHVTPSSRGFGQVHRSEHTRRHMGLEVHRVTSNLTGLFELKGRRNATDQKAVVVPSSSFRHPNRAKPSRSRPIPPPGATDSPPLALLFSPFRGIFATFSRLFPRVSLGSSQRPGWPGMPANKWR